MQRRIEYLHDIKTGEDILADEFFSRPEHEIFEFRRTLVDCNRLEESRIVCGFCGQPVHIAGTLKKEFFFKHYQELGDCPIKTQGKLSQADIDRIRYNGAREGIEHRTLKEFVYQILCKDNRCSNVYKEIITWSSFDSTKWRKPDVICTFQGKSLVFEIQLSTTYLNVIAEREAHYRDEGVFIIWLFSNFDIENDRFVQKDIYYANYGNAFAIDAEARSLSKQAGKLIVHCFRRIEPSMFSAAQWKEDFVALDELTFDSEVYKAYYVDSNLEQLKTDFEGYWLQKHCLNWEAQENAEKALQIRLQHQGIIYERDIQLQRALDALYSLKHKKMIGYNFKQNPILQLTHYVIDKKNAYVYIYLWSLEIFGHKEFILKHDRTKAFRRKVEEFKRIRKSNADPPRPKKYDPFLRLLFPELAAKIDKG
jgi:competence CoiA-like predicted nuclease